MFSLPIDCSLPSANSFTFIYFIHSDVFSLLFRAPVSALSHLFHSFWRALFLFPSVPSILPFFALLHGFFSLPHVYLYLFCSLSLGSSLHVHTFISSNLPYIFIHFPFFYLTHYFIHQLRIHRHLFLFSFFSFFHFPLHPIIHSSDSFILVSVSFIQTYISILFLPLPAYRLSFFIFTSISFIFLLYFLSLPSVILLHKPQFIHSFRYICSFFFLTLYNSIFHSLYSTLMFLLFLPTSFVLSSIRFFSPLLPLSIILPLLCMHRPFFTFILPYFLFVPFIPLSAQYQTSYWLFLSHVSTNITDSARTPRFMSL